MGGIGLRPWEIEKLTVDDIEAYVRGFFRFKKMDHQAVFEGGRLAGFMSVMPYLPKHIKKPSEVIAFDWDAVTSVKKQTEYSDDSKAWFLEQDKIDVEAALRGDPKARIKVNTPAFERLVNNLQEAGIDIDGYDYSDITD